MFTNKGGKRMILDIVGKEQFREKIRENNPELKKKIQGAFEKIHNEPLRCLSFTKFDRFFRDGDRKAYEKDYFSLLERLSVCCVMSMLFPEEKEYSAMAEDAIWAVCDEFTWVLPAHLQEIKHRRRT